MDLFSNVRLLSIGSYGESTFAPRHWLVRVSTRLGGTSKALALGAASTLGGCHDVVVDATSPNSSLLSASQALSESKLAKLREMGEGCAIIARDSVGPVRALALSRDQLPFALPPIVRGEGTNPGNGRIAHMH